MERLCVNYVYAAPDIQVSIQILGPKLELVDRSCTWSLVAVGVHMISPLTSTTDGETLLLDTKVSQRILT